MDSEGEGKESGERRQGHEEGGSPWALGPREWEDPDTPEEIADLPLGLGEQRELWPVATEAGPAPWCLPPVLPCSKLCFFFNQQKICVGPNDLPFISYCLLACLLTCAMIAEDPLSGRILCDSVFLTLSTTFLGFAPRTPQLPTFSVCSSTSPNQWTPIL